MPTYHIHFQGQVQGVGFRPFVYKKAVEYQLKGWVNNTNTGVHIEIEGNEKIISKFYHDILNKPPELAIITNSSINLIDKKEFTGFKIIHSQKTEKPNLLLTPDYGICSDCLKDIFDINNRRYQYAFTTCTNCGPRYSIIKKLPYDRENTTMDNFPMCDICEAEYYNPVNRRYFSQTNSCPDCAVKMSVLNSKKQYTQKKIIELIQQSLKKGKIIAIKGIGGYLLMVDATNAETINTLRNRKHRPTKPFALMYPDDKLLFADVIATQKEIKAYNSIAAPIILFQLKEKIVSGLQKDLIAPGLNQIGVMKAYTPLYYLIMEDIGFPVIATSANLSESPIIYQDNKAKQELSAIADIIIGNNREIIIPQDDSVIKFSRFAQQKIIIRRSRSLSPTFIDPFKNIKSKQSLLAMGAGLKSSFAFHTQNNTYISQYLGNLNSFESQETFEKVLNHFFTIFETTPNIIVVDKHPQYFSTQLGVNLSEKFNTKIHYVQHHKAHFSAVLAENGLIHHKNKILGVIWDGVGLGDDDTIWGSEFFVYRDKKMQRIAHFGYFPHLALDKFAMEPRLPAFSLCSIYKTGDEIINNKFKGFELKNYEKLITQSSIQTNSCGRLFDAVASLLNIKDINTFEGEAAMLLENMATNFYLKNKNYKQTYDFEYQNSNILLKSIIEGIVRDIEKETPKHEIAFKFHLSLIKIIKLVATKHQVDNIAFSGGVFQNALLIDLIHQELGNEFQLYFHKQLSPNDENISYGQLIYINHKIK